MTVDYVTSFDEEGVRVKKMIIIMPGTTMAARDIYLEGLSIIIKDLLRIGCGRADQADN